MTNLGQRLKEERTRLGISQEALGKLGGQSRKSVIRYEAGETAPDAQFLSAIANAGADVLYILTGRREQSLHMDDIDRLTTAIRLVEEWIEAHDVELEPKKKAEVVSLAYEMLADRKGGEEKVERMLRLVA